MTETPVSYDDTLDDRVIELRTDFERWCWSDTATFGVLSTDPFGVIRADGEPVRMPQEGRADEWTTIPGHPAVQARINVSGRLELRRTPRG